MLKLPLADYHDRLFNEVGESKVLCQLSVDRKDPNKSPILRELNQMDSFIFSTSFTYDETGSYPSADLHYFHPNFNAKKISVNKDEKFNKSVFLRTEEKSRLEHTMYSARWLFIVLDLILIAHRFSIAYLKCTKLYQSYKPSYGKENGCRLNTMQNGNARMSNECSLSNNRNNISRDRFVARDVKNYNENRDCCVAGNEQLLHCNHINNLNNRPNASHVSALTNLSYSVTNIMNRKFLQSCILNNAIPPILICTVIIVVFYVLVLVIMHILNAEKLINTDAFKMYLRGINQYIKYSNEYNQQEADYLNSAVLKSCDQHMLNDISNLQVLLEYFTKGTRCICDMHIILYNIGKI